MLLMKIEAISLKKNNSNKINEFPENKAKEWNNRSI